mmetsp:Transcript_61447/g.174541  ORF Transcript_61447/g.174541 Transcript_61447/m.174541 type:complete len:238 (-) Transcript_61447:1603-2316(-)
MLRLGGRGCTASRSGRSRSSERMEFNASFEETPTSADTVRCAHRLLMSSLVTPAPSAMTIFCGLRNSTMYFPLGRSLCIRRRRLSVHSAVAIGASILPESRFRCTVTSKGRKGGCTATSMRSAALVSVSRSNFIIMSALIQKDTGGLTWMSFCSFFGTKSKVTLPRWSSAFRCASVAAESSVELGAHGHTGTAFFGCSKRLRIKVEHALDEPMPLTFAMNLSLKVPCPIAASNVPLP